MTCRASLLPDYLSWRGEDRLTGPSLSTLTATLSQRLASTLLAIKGIDPARAAAFHDRIEQLDDEAFIRVVLAPESGYRFGYRRDAIDETAAFLDDALTVEEYRSGRRELPERPCWSALGDLWLAGAARTPDFVAPRVRDVVIDFASPWVLGKLPHIAGEAVSITDEHRREALDRIAAAFGVIERGSARTAVATYRHTRVIVVRSDPSRPDFYTSASTTLCLARSVLRNPFAASATPLELADGLVHEAIHCICDLAEVHDGLWLPAGQAAYELRIASPWTGRELDIHTYLQACWVWYGLWHFWAQALEAEAAPPQEGLRMLGRALRGFSGGAALARLTTHRAAVAKVVVSALEQAQEALLTRMRGWEREVALALTGSSVASSQPRKA